jgi:SAM-dependent methyltransferase
MAQLFCNSGLHATLAIHWKGPALTDAAQLHADQLDYWNGAGGARWVANQSLRDLMLADFASAALAKAAAQPGESVIDVGCGCGETSAELAEAVGPTGSVLAIDVSAPILAVAAERLAPFPAATTVLADAAAYPFAPASADLMFSRFGVMFFGDPVAAFANLRLALKPSGRLVFACWRTPAENQWMTSALDTVFAIVPRPPAADPTLPGPFAFADAERVASILTQAGFNAPTFDRYDPIVDISVGAGVEGAVGTALEFGPTARLLAEQPEEVKDRVVDALRTYYAALAQDGAIRLPAAIWIVQTTAAGQ